MNTMLHGDGSEVRWKLLELQQELELLNTRLDLAEGLKPDDYDALAINLIQAHKSLQIIRLLLPV